MFDEILGLPVHPLVIHAAVVFIPLLSALAVGYAVLPRWRARLGWAVVLLAVAAPVSAIVALLSGTALVNNRFGGEFPEGVLGQRVEEHAGFGLPLVACTLALGVVALLLVYAAGRATSGPDSGGGPARAATAVKTSAGRTTVTMVLSVATVVLAVVALYLTVRAGHSGAVAVWGE